MRSLIVLAALALAACTPEPPREVPPEAMAEDKPVPEPLHIVINPDGRIFWQGEEISEEEYHRRLNATAEDPKGPFKLAIHADGTYSLDGAPVTLDQLDAFLAEVSRMEPVPEVHLEPDRLAKYRYVAAVMELTQRHGMAKIGVIGGGQE